MPCLLWHMAQSCAALSKVHMASATVKSRSSSIKTSGLMNDRGTLKAMRDAIEQMMDRAKAGGSALDFRVVRGPRCPQHTLGRPHMEHSPDGSRDSTTARSEERHGRVPACSDR